MSAKDDGWEIDPADRDEFPAWVDDRCLFDCTSVETLCFSLCRLGWHSSALAYLLTRPLQRLVDALNEARR